MAFSAAAVSWTQAGVLRSGGQRKFGLPDGGNDPTDTELALAAFLARRRELSGERRLFLAVFMAALDDLRRYPRGTKPYAAAWRWIMSDEDGWPLAFRPACETLGLDAGAVRARVLEALAVRGAVLPGPPPRVRCSRSPALVVGAA